MKQFIYKMEKNMINLKLNLTENELKAAQALAIRLKTQDNRCTALPICFLLQDVEDRRAFDEGEFVLFIADNDDREWRGEDEDDIIRQILASRREDIEECEIDDYDKAVDDLSDEIKDEVRGNCYEMNHEFVTKRIFLTEEAANNHLKANRHHYSDKARIYVDHFWRDPEMELVYKILTSFMYADIEQIPEPKANAEGSFLGEKNWKMYSKNEK
jgi:hypothetical protein